MRTFIFFFEGTKVAEIEPTSHAHPQGGTAGMEFSPHRVVFGREIARFFEFLSRNHGI